MKLISFLALLPVASAFLHVPSLSQMRTPTIVSRNLFGGGGGGGEKKKGMGAMVDQFKQVQEVTKRAKKMQDDLDAARLSGSSADGAVIMVLNGKGTPITTEISDECFSAGAAAVSTGLTEALVAANEECKKIMAEKMTEMYSGLNLPAGMLPGL